MRRAVSLFFLLVAPLAAVPEQGGRAEEAEILAAWSAAGPGERMRMRATLDRIEKERGFVEARCVLVPVGTRTYTLAELFGQVLEPALATPVAADPNDDLGLQAPHLAALNALVALRKVHKAPAPVGTATLNLLMGYARRVLDAWQLTPRVRLHILMEVLKNVRELEGRALPDARTAWLVDEGILPSLLGLARRYEDDEPTREAISQAAALLTLPSVLEPSAIAHLASLTSGVDSRDVLLRAYRNGRLDALGVGALARSVVAQGRDDAAFLTGAAPVLLELVGDPRVNARDRGALVDLILERYARLEVLRPSAEDLLSAAYGASHQPLSHWKALRQERSGPVTRAKGGETYRFLQVVLLRPKPDATPIPARVVRADVPPSEAIRTSKGRYIGMLVPSTDAEHVDFLGPTPGLRGAADNRLVRRTLQLEHIAIRPYGPRGEEIELCVALPRDGTEPVPEKGARLGHVLDLIRVRLERTRDPTENRDLVDLLVRIGTPIARKMAVQFALGAVHAASLLELIEDGDASAAMPLLKRIGDLEPAERDRAFAAVLGLGDAALRARVAELAGSAAVEVAAPAGDALLQSGDASGVSALLRHKDKYARLCGAALALRLTPLAEGLRIVPNKQVDMAAIAKLAGEAFPKKMGGAWRNLGGWLPIALAQPERVRTLRGYESLYAGKGQPKVSPARFAQGWTAAVREDKFDRQWPAIVAYVLTPKNPGRGMKPPALDGLLDALESKATKDPLRRAWIDTLAVLAAVHSGIEFDARFLKLADLRLRRIAKDTTPVGARRRPGLAWPIWAARDAARR
ncbi:MAG: hypothetical protein ACYTGZ_22055 [Planctomycetota bacterium]